MRRKMESRSAPRVMAALSSRTSTISMERRMLRTIRGKETVIEAITAAAVVKAMRHPKREKRTDPISPLFPQQKEKDIPRGDRGHDQGKAD